MTSAIVRVRGSVAILGSDRDGSGGHRRVDALLESRAGGVDGAATGGCRGLLEGHAGRQRSRVPLDGGVVLTVLLHLHPRSAGPAEDVLEPRLRVQANVLEGVGVR